MIDSSMMVVAMIVVAICCIPVVSSAPVSEPSGLSGPPQSYALYAVLVAAGFLIMVTLLYGVLGLEASAIPKTRISKKVRVAAFLSEFRVSLAIQISFIDFKVNGKQLRSGALSEVEVVRFNELCTLYDKRLLEDKSSKIKIRVARHRAASPDNAGIFFTNLSFRAAYLVYIFDIYIYIFVDIYIYIYIYI